MQTSRSRGNLCVCLYGIFTQRILANRNVNIRRSTAIRIQSHRNAHECNAIRLFHVCTLGTASTPTPCTWLSVCACVRLRILNGINLSGLLALRSLCASDNERSNWNRTQSTAFDAIAIKPRLGDSDKRPAFGCVHHIARFANRFFTYSIVNEHCTAVRSRTNGKFRLTFQHFLISKVRDF